MKDEDVRLACDKFCGKCEDCDPLRWALKVRYWLDRGSVEHLKLHLDASRKQVRWVRRGGLRNVCDCDATHEVRQFKRSLASLCIDDADGLADLVDRVEAAGLEKLTPVADALQMRAHLVKVMRVEV